MQTKKRTKRPFKGQSLSTHPHSHAARPRPRTEGPHKADGSLFDSEIVARWNAGELSSLGVYTSIMADMIVHRLWRCLESKSTF